MSSAILSSPHCVTQNPPPHPLVTWNGALFPCFTPTSTHTYVHSYAHAHVQSMRLPCSVGEESACSAGDPGSIPGSGRSPGEGKGYPLQYSGLEKSMDCRVHGIAKSQTQLSHFHFISLHKASWGASDFTDSSGHESSHGGNIT